MTSEGTGGVVNELLMQMQSFDTPTGWQRVRTWVVEHANLVLPADRQLRLPSPTAPNILLIAATNRADSLDPALLRPAASTVGWPSSAPGREDRKRLIAYFLQRKAHHAELDAPDARDHIAASTRGYTPVTIEQADGRGAGQRPAPRRHPHEPAGPGGRPPGRGRRPGAARRLHRPRAATHRHARVRACRRSPGWRLPTAAWRSSASSSGATRWACWRTATPTRSTRSRGPS